MSNPWATGSRSSASPPSSCTTGDKRNLIPPDPPDPLSHLPLAQYPPLSPTIPSRRSRAIAFSTVAPLLSTPIVQQISAGLSTTDIAPCNVDTEMAPPPPAPRTKTPPATKEPPVPNHHHSSQSKSTAKPSAKITPKNPTPINPPSALPSATTTPSPKLSSYSLPLDPKSVVPPAIPMEAPSDSRSSSYFSTPKKLKQKVYQF
ncbi:hypothetical protein YC2023_043545 [Brassica napus]